MDFLELAKNRFSLRKFSDKKVEKEKIDYILAAMQAAPTAVNFQPQRILVLTDEKELEKVSKCTKFAFNPPLNFLVCYDKETSWTRGNDGHDEGEIDAAIVATHMMLAAKSVGLGTTWVGSFNPKDVKEHSICLKIMFPLHFYRQVIRQTTRSLRRLIQAEKI